MQPERTPLTEEVLQKLNAVAQQEILDHKETSFQPHTTIDQPSEQEMEPVLAGRSRANVASLVSYVQNHQQSDGVHEAMETLLKDFTAQRRTNPDMAANIQTRTQEYLLQRTLQQLGRKRGFEPTDFSSL